MQDAPAHVLRLLGMNERLRSDAPGVVDAVLAKAREVFPEYVEDATLSNTHLWLNCGPFQKFPSLSPVRPQPHTAECRGRFYAAVRHTGIHLAKPTAVTGFSIGTIRDKFDIMVGPDEYATLVAIHDTFKDA